MSFIGSIVRYSGVGLGLTVAAAMTVSVAGARELTYAYHAANNGAVAEAMKWWGQEVEKRTDGELTVRIFWQQGLVKFQDTLPSVKSGLADMGELAAAFSRAETPAWSLADTGSLSSDPYVATRAYDNMRGQFPQIDAELQAAGVKYLWHYSWGGVVLIGTGEPITHPDQYSGQNVRVSSTLARAIDIKGWNATPVSIRFNEMFQGLQRGVVDGGSSYLNSVLPFKLNEVIDYVVEIDQGQHTGVIVMNQETWDSLSPKAQQVLDELRPEMIERLTRTEIEESLSVRDTLKNSKERAIQVINVDDATSQVWGDAMQLAFQSNVKKAAGAFKDAEAFATAYLAEIKKVAAKVSSDGYPWTN